MLKMSYPLKMLMMGVVDVGLGNNVDDWSGEKNYLPPHQLHWRCNCRCIVKGSNEMKVLGEHILHHDVGWDTLMLLLHLQPLR